MTSHSKTIIERLKRTLFKYDMEIARVEGEINLYKEKIDLLSQSTRKKDLQALTLAKIDKENYQVFLKRLKINKTALLRRVSLVVDKYEGDYAEVFKKHYFENKEADQIAEETGLPIYTVKQILGRLNKDVSEYLGWTQKKEGD